MFLDATPMVGAPESRLCAHEISSQSVQSKIGNRVDLCSRPPLQGSLVTCTNGKVTASVSFSFFIEFPIVYMYLRHSNPPAVAADALLRARCVVNKSACNRSAVETQASTTCFSIHNRNQFLLSKIGSLRTSTYKCYIDYEPHSTSHAGIRRHYCECANGTRTVGCCSHVAAAVYYLSHARYLARIIKPAEILNSMFLDGAAVPVIEEDSDED